MNILNDAQAEAIHGGCGGKSKGAEMRGPCGPEGIGPMPWGAAVKGKIVINMIVNITTIYANYGIVAVASNQNNGPIFASN